MPTNPHNAHTRRRGRIARADHDRRRGSAASRGYGRDHQAWRKDILAKDPLCVFCKKRGRIEPATVADHITPIAVDASRRLDLDNGRGVCEPCHQLITEHYKQTGMNEMPEHQPERSPA